MNFRKRGSSLELNKYTGSPDPNHHREEYIVGRAVTNGGNESRSRV